MNLYYSGKSYSRSHRRSRLPRFLSAAACIVLIGALGTGLFFLRKQHQNHELRTAPAALSSPRMPDSSEAEAPTEGDGFVMPDTPAAELLHQAYLLASGYDYDAAIELLKGSEEFACRSGGRLCHCRIRNHKSNSGSHPHQQNHPRVFSHADCRSIQILRR